MASGCKKRTLRQGRGALPHTLQGAYRPLTAYVVWLSAISQEVYS